MRRAHAGGTDAPRPPLSLALSDCSSVSSPRTERHGRAPLSLPSPRNFDPDGLHADDFDDRDIFSRFVADQRSPKRRCDSNNSSSYGLPMASSSFALCHAEKSSLSPRPTAPTEPRSPTTSHLSPSCGAARSLSKTRPLGICRPCSPVADTPPQGVVSTQTMQQFSPRNSPRRAILAAPDAEKISAWLRSLKCEHRQFSSYFLYCEMLFRESDSLLRGKPTPNRLQTAIAFHCLCQASGLFARHEDVLQRICRDLGAAIFIPNSSFAHNAVPVLTDDDMEALEFYANQVTYYDHQSALRQQRDDMEKELRVQTTRNTEKAKEEQLNLAKIKDLEARYKIKALDRISHKNTANEELNEKLHVVLQSFQYMEEPEKQRTVLGVIEALRAHITADTLVTITDQISLYERDKLLRMLFQDDITQLTEKIRSEVLATSSAQQNAILERSAARITRFQTLIWDTLRRSSASTDGSSANAPRSLHDDDDLCDQDRKVLESISDIVDELQAARRKCAELEGQVLDAEQATNNLRWKSNVQLNEAQDAALRHAKEMVELKEEFQRSRAEMVEKEVQTDKTKAGRGGSGGNGGAGDDDLDAEDDDDYTGGGGSGGGGGGSGGGTKSRRRRGAPDEDDELIVKNRRLNQYGFGIASLIDQAKIPSSKIRKILAKRKPLTLNELHSIIVGYYQAKIFQDVQDDNAGKVRGNLAQFILDMYTLHYGLKDLAISQLVFLDASIRKFASESARVRTFGLLTGSLEPESHACSVQGIDFFLLVVVVLFNAGTFKRGRKQSIHVAQNLKTFFGDGVVMSPKSVVLKTDVLCTTIDLIFSFMRNEAGGKLDRFKDEIRLMCSSPATSTSTGLEVDIALEKIMNYWFVLYGQQIEDIHAMFTLVDTNGDGTLDFREFCDVVQVLEPGMDRREVLAIYNKAAGDDHVIDKDEFVQVMLAHQRGVILKEFYSGDSSKKIVSGIQLRKQTIGTAVGSPPSSSSISSASSSSAGSRGALQYKTLSGGVAHLDREESYASLVAAMSAVTEGMQPLANDEDDDTAGGDDDPSQGGRVQESVPFMALSKLSKWASEAKGKLLSSKRVAGGSIREEEEPSVEPTAPTPKRVATPGLTVFAEQSQDSFERDVNALLEQALSKTNIDLKEFF